MKVKIGLMGTAGTGKTWQALSIGSNLGKTMAVIDSERGRAMAYAGNFDFDHQQLVDTSPEAYMDALSEAYEGGYEVVIVDGISHEWAGKDGILSSVDRFGGWKVATPRHDSFIEALFSYPGHLIATMRAKTQYQVDEVERDGRKKQEITKLGVGPIQRDNVEYEFDLLALLELDHSMRIHKSIIDGISTDQVFAPGDDPYQLGRELADTILTWVNEGEEVKPPESADEEKIDRLRKVLLVEGFDLQKIEETFRKRKLELGALTPEYVLRATDDALLRLKQRGLQEDGSPVESPFKAPEGALSASTEDVKAEAETEQTVEADEKVAAK